MHDYISEEDERGLTVNRFIDTNVFIYVMTGHPQFGEPAKAILERIEQG